MSINEASLNCSSFESDIVLNLKKFLARRLLTSFTYPYVFHHVFVQILYNCKEVLSSIKNLFFEISKYQKINCSFVNQNPFHHLLTSPNYQG
jgi:hypothetical protein